MTYAIEHRVLQHAGSTTVRSAEGVSRAEFLLKGDLDISHPGRLTRSVKAECQVRTRFEPPDGGPARIKTEAVSVPCTVTIRMPDGALFEDDHVTMRDIFRFRDLRGVSHPWSFEISGVSEPRATDDDNFTRMIAGDAFAALTLVETISPASAPPLVDTVVAEDQASFEFDLWRLGTFTATVRSTFGGLGQQRRTLRLFTPDGNLVAESRLGRIDFR